jgi:hypothetical protein
LRLLSAFYHLKHTVLIYGIMNAKIKIGDSVVVKNDVRDADFPDLLLAGFQGRIIELSEDEDGNELVDIEWDSQSLRGMADYVSLCEEEELDWTTCTLFLDEVEPTEARDTPEDVRNVANELLQSWLWTDLGEQGKRIAAVVKHTDPDDEMEGFEAWQKYLSTIFSFPFEAEVSELPESDKLKSGEVVKVKGFAEADELMGVMMLVNSPRGHFEYPLCDLQTDNTKFQQVLEDYNIWYAEC